MSLRGDIVGWVIRRLAEIDAADETQRTALFRKLRTEIEANGFGGAPAAACLPHFESAVAMQEVYWLRESPSRAASASVLLQEPVKLPPAPAKLWQWPKNLSIPDKPPGPAPGKPVGPFADHVYQTVTLAVPGGTCELRLSCAYDPACVLTAESPEIGFRFRTRAANFAHAADHLASVLARAGLDLPPEIRMLGP